MRRSSRVRLIICFGAWTILASLTVLKLANGFNDDVFVAVLAAILDFYVKIFVRSPKKYFHNIS